MGTRQPKLGLQGALGRREGRVESPRSPVTPPRWWPKPWRSSPHAPETAGKAYSEAARPRRAGRQPPRGSRGPGTARPGPYRPPGAQRSGPAPRSTTGASGPPPPAARSSSRRRYRRRESDRLPVQGRAAAACAKLGYPRAALAACRPPSRPRLILRSPCRQAAISDKRLRNLPKCAGPEMAEPGRSRAREAGAVATFRTAPEGSPRPRTPPQSSLESRSRGGGSGGSAGDCGKRAAKARARVRAASRASGKKGHDGPPPPRALTPAPYKCPSPFRETYLGSAERMPPTVLERGGTRFQRARGKPSPKRNPYR